jgi:hypothetical protein
MFATNKYSFTFTFLFIPFLMLLVALVYTYGKVGAKTVIAEPQKTEIKKRKTGETFLHLHFRRFVKHSGTHNFLVNLVQSNSNSSTNTRMDGAPHLLTHSRSRCICCFDWKIRLRQIRHRNIGDTSCALHISAYTRALTVNHTNCRRHIRLSTWNARIHLPRYSFRINTALFARNGLWYIQRSLRLWLSHQRRRIWISN